MNPELMDQVSSQVHKIYPQLFDNPSSEDKINSFITQAYLRCRSYQLTDDDLQILLQVYTAYLLQSDQETDGVATTVKVDTLQVGLSANAKGSNYYYNQFKDLLKSLGVGTSGVEFL